MQQLRARPLLWDLLGRIDIARTLLATPGTPEEDLVPSLLALSDVMATGWHAAVSAGVGPGSSVVVVGDGAVGLCGVIAAVRLGASLVVAMSRHEPRQALGRERRAAGASPNSSRRRR